MPCTAFRILIVQTVTSQSNHISPHCLSLLNSNLKLNDILSPPSYACLHSVYHVRRVWAGRHGGVVASTLASQQVGVRISVLPVHSGTPVSSHWSPDSPCQVNWSVYIDRRLEWEWMSICLSVSPAIGWRPIQGAPCLSPLDSWHRPPATQNWRNIGKEKGWMDDCAQTQDI